MTKRTFSVLITVAVAFGCATAGTDFNYQSRSNLEVRQTTKQDAIGLLGEPTSVQTKLINDYNYEVVQHSFASSSAGLGRETVSRLSTLEFKNGVLNAKIYLSSLDEDSTDFSLENAKQIIVDTSTVDDAIRLLGKPSGSGQCPSSINMDLCGDEDARSVVSWAHAAKMKVTGELPASKVLGLALDDDGTVVAMRTAN